VLTYQLLAEVCGEYLRKGSPVLAEGRLQFREWKTGKGERRTRLEVRADQVHFLERKMNESGAGETAAPAHVKQEDELF